MVQSCCGFAWYRSHISGMQPCSIVGTRNTLHWRVHTKNMFCVAQHYMIFLYCLFKACVTKFMLVMFALVDALWRSKNFHKISVDGTLGQTMEKNNGKGIVIIEHIHCTNVVYSKRAKGKIKARISYQCKPSNVQSMHLDATNVVEMQAIWVNCEIRCVCNIIGKPWDLYCGILPYYMLCIQ